MSKFFIDRPVFAWVIAIVVMVAGAISILRLPIAQYPAIAPPTISISATYPGASSKTVEDSVTQVIEQKMNGLDHLRYMSATSDATGSATITLTFDAGTDPDIAQVQTQNKLQLAMPLLPQEVQRQGVRVTKAVNNFLLIAALVSEDGRLGRADLADYAAASVVDPLGRVNGVGEVMLFGSQYSMHVWLKPDRLLEYGLTPADVSRAIQAQNALVSAGQLGGAPAVPGQRLNATVTAQSRLRTAAEFEDVLLRVNPDGSKLHLRDVARVELAGETAEIETSYNGRPTAGIGVKLASGANALATADAVRARLKELSPFFPAGVSVQYPMDTTPFVRLSIEEVVKTLLEAIALVFLVMLVFLGNLRATLIPTIAVPVVLLGTFGVLAAAGFTLNTLTMFGVVLAIGLLVDDAIVVVENVERVMAEEGLSPREATRKSMGQITGALVGIALVLSAVFVPMAFFGGSVGVIYRQFSITLVSAMVLSVLVAMILTPALCATFLKPVERGHRAGGFFGWFDRNYDRARESYEGVLARVLRRTGRALLVYGALAGAMAFLLLRLPSGFLPDEDQGVVFAQVMLPPGSTLEQTREVSRRVGDYFLQQEKEAVQSVLVVDGFGFAGRGQNVAIAFVSLKDWSQRKAPGLKAAAVAGRAMGAFAQYRGALAFAFTPPAVMELGNATGFDLQLQDRGGVGHEALMAARNQLLGAVRGEAGVAGVRPNGLEDTSEYKIDVDRQKASALGVSLADVNATLASTWGTSYVDDFLDGGRIKKVYMQADAPYRMRPEDVSRLYVRNAQGQMTPFSAFTTGRWTTGSPRLERFNGVPSLEILGAPAPGRSSGEAMAAMERLARQLPPGVGYEWTGLSFEERLSGSQAPALYAISLLVVFLCLCALYESWSIPLAVILVVPLGVLGAVGAAWAFGLSNDVYFQVALLTTIGLSTKNAILIVEFAKELEGREGRTLVQAALEAARLRLRPILMTSIAFVLGVLPLALSRGAGAGSQNAIGISLIGGMLSATFLAVLLVPVFFVVIRRLAGAERPVPVAAPPPAAIAASGGRADV
ncbi:efflux RND transporter permease subunit [Anaeromyxobacter paludicola]|uniref:Multidrug efflux RND transporter permease subunit n=1 Tax=Anaeromyxobacter paludicola TaxID=2918171 RepID=A0ABM7XDT7_9BACT|nr:efflux RND transporter permease subunit [Anaeromyxobacter paludicola]BDG10049.1 multidrug efflux RND transporter permease subunit [Anaeromyxobacter paludicola]